jgi:hypothetical protein
MLIDLKNIPKSKPEVYAEPSPKGTVLKVMWKW